MRTTGTPVPLTTTARYCIRVYRTDADMIPVRVRLRGMREERSRSLSRPVDIFLKFHSGAYCRLFLDTGSPLEIDSIVIVRFSDTQNQE